MNAEKHLEVTIDTSGDFFGNYDDDTMGDSGGTNAPENTQPTDEDDEDEDDAAALNAEQEHGLEPPRTITPPPLEDDPTTPDMEDPSPDDSLHDRGRAEPSLENHPYIVKFPDKAAGAVYSSSGLTENQHYEQKVGDESQMNPYAPFASKLEWEIGRWAKLRGPSSTAFNELMAIEGVSPNFKVASNIIQSL
jgi:hypothetical protein